MLQASLAWPVSYSPQSPQGPSQLCGRIGVGTLRVLACCLMTVCQIAGYVDRLANSRSPGCVVYGLAAVMKVGRYAYPLQQSL